jgi:hypothetical protein
MENDLIFSGTNPVVINYNGNKDDIYAPVRGSSCDISIVSSEFLDDLYTPYKDRISVKIVKEMDTGSEREIIDDTKISTHENDCVLWFIDANGNETYDPHITSAYYFTDIDGDQCAVLTINDRNYGCVYDESRNAYVENDKWGLASLGIFKHYFTDGTNSYLLTKSDTSSLSYPVVNTWTEGRWSNPVTQTNLNNSRDFNIDLCYSNSYVWWFISNSSTYQMFRFNTSTKQFVVVRSIDKNNIVLQKMVGFTGNGRPIFLCDDHNNDCQTLVTISTRADMFVKWSDMPGQDEYDHYQVFNDKSGVIYCLPANGRAGAVRLGSLWMHNMSEEDPDWSRIDYFEGIQGESIHDMFLVAKKEHGANVYWWYGSSYYTYSLVMGDGWYRTEHVIATRTIFDGYQTPNTYSQAVTQNLDHINMTCIDPVSILKYVTIDKLFTKSNIYTYRQIIGKALAYVVAHSNTLYVERTVSYGGSYTGSNGLLDLKVQVNNFWDESGEPSTAYDMIAEMLKPFCLTLAFDGESFQIYDQNKTTGVRLFDMYTITTSGTLSGQGVSAESTVVYDFDNGDWKSNNTQEPSIEIGSTYDKVTAVVSTQTPSFSQSVFDIVDYNQRDKYDIFQMNVQRNKTKGYRYISWNNIKLDTADAWYYIWNGVYTDELYHLQSNGGYVNGYLNINKAYNYLTGNAGNPTDYGSILNFYGGTANPQGTGKQQSQEKPVEIHKRITAYAADNGTPLEFLELSDLAWSWSSTYDPESGYATPEMAKTNPTNAKFGSSIAMQESNKVSYHQEYDMNLSSLDEHTISLNLTQSYSRTGIDSNIDIYQNNTATNKGFDLSWDDDEQKWRAHLYSASVSYFPGLWDAASVKVNGVYFNRYRTASTLFRPSRVQPVWDKRRVNMYVKLSDNTVLQFNGKEWVSGSQVSDTNSFFLMKMMNDEKLYHTDFKYNLIETSDGSHYSLTNERYTYYTDEVGGVVDHSVSGGTTNYCDVYKAEGNTWYQYIDDCGEGQLKIKMPAIDDLNAKVCVDIYNSTMLGMTGQSNTSGYNYSEAIYALVEGTGRHWDDDSQEYVYITLSSSNCANYGSIIGSSSYILFIPVNASYVKAEHLDVDISVTVPESNLGQMFSESDIQYTIDKKKNYVEEFNDISFQVNTYNDLVHSSFSYLIFDSTVADPGNFIISDTNVRPELYAVQAYMNWLSVVRKYYNKTLVPRTSSSTAQFSNIRTFLTSPEVGDNRMMVISDSWDVLTNRHSICAIECQDLDVDYVEQFSANELPRKARAERYNLPTAYKQS